MFHDFRLRAVAIPTKPSPNIASVPGSETVLEPSLMEDEFQYLQLPGIWVHSGGSASKEDDTSNSNAVRIIFISLLF